MSYLGSGHGKTLFFGGKSTLGQDLETEQLHTEMAKSQGSPLRLVI